MKSMLILALADAAATLAGQPAGVQLRYLQTLTEIAVEKNSTIIFPVPVEFISAFQSMLLDEKPKEKVDGSQPSTLPV